MVRAIEAFEKVDILINSAGINIRGAIDEVTPEQFREVQEINVTGTWLANQLAPNERTWLRTYHQLYPAHSAL